MQQTGKKRRRSSVDATNANADEKVSSVVAATPALRKKHGIALNATPVEGHPSKRLLHMKIMQCTSTPLKVLVCSATTSAEIANMNALRKRVLKAIDCSFAAGCGTVKGAPPGVVMGADGFYKGCTACKMASSSTKGELVICDACPNAFHLSCIKGLPSTIASADESCQILGCALSAYRH